MSTILITGGTGLIGKPLTEALTAKGHQVVILTREVPAKSDNPNVRFAQWDVAKGTIDASAVAGADHIIHLAGAGVAEKRWSKKRKKEILDSRTKSADLLMDTLKNAPNKVRSFTSASAIGWYGADPVIPNPRPFTEDDPAAPDFLGEVCTKWEQSVKPVTTLNAPANIRLVIIRTGIVLSKKGGALAEFAKPLKAGLATILGSGRQMISWIHIDDIVRLYVDAIQNESMNGIYNAVAPKPVSNKELVLKLAQEERKKFYIPLHVPAFALKLAMGEMSVEVLKSTTVSCDRLHIEGFTFLYPSIEAALKELTTQKQ